MLDDKQERSTECLVSTVKHGDGKCMAASGVGTLKIVNGRLDAKRCARLICRALRKDDRKLCGRDFVFQQDGAPYHRANSTMSWFARKGISVSPWPSQSPDLSPIEHLWEEIKKRLDAKPCKDLEELKAAIFELLENIDEDVTKKLVSSMSWRCASVTAAHGGSTKY